MNRLTGQSVLVTGGAGLIGSFVVDRLLSVDARVIVADDFKKGRRAHLAHVEDRIEIREGDLEDPAMMDRAFEGVDIVFHLASRAFGIGYSSKNHLSIFQHNERITHNLIESLSRRRPLWLVATSSSCVYPDDGPDTVPELPLYSGEPEAANWGYGWAKRMLEQKSIIFAREWKVPLTIVRPFNIYGERYAWVGEASQAIPMLTKKIMDGNNPVVVWGSGSQRRNYLHAVDCANAIVGLVENAFEGAVNIGTEETVTVNQLVHAIARAAACEVQIINDTSRPEGRRVKSSDAALLRRSYPGFEPTVSLEDGLARMVGWYRANF